MSDNATWDAIWPRESLIPYLMAASVAVKAELHCAEKEVWYMLLCTSVIYCFVGSRRRASCSSRAQVPDLDGAEPAPPLIPP